MLIDLKTAQRFLTLLDDEAQTFTFQCFDDSEVRATRNASLARVLHGSLEECGPPLSKLNDRGAGVYVMVCAGDGRGRKEENVVGVRALFADFDGTPLPSQWAAEPHIVVESSAGKFHAYSAVAGVGLDEFSGLQHALAGRLGSDPSVKDLPRVMRLPGFYHRKREPFQTRIVFERLAQPYELSELVSAFELANVNGSAYEPREQAQSPGESAVGWLANIRQGIALHDSLRDLAAHLAAKAMRFEEICALLETAMNASSSARDERWRARFREIPALVNSAIQKFRGTTPGPDSTPDDWPEPVDFLRRPAAPPLSAEDTVPSIGEYALLFARAAGFCPTTTLVAAITASAAAIHDEIRLHLPGASSWFESARLWVIPIGPPACGKTPGIRAMCAPLFELHRELVDAWKRDNDGKEPAEREPRPALMTNDATIEKLSELLKENPRGMLYSCDEFESWLGSHDCYRGNGAGSRDRGEWLRLYDGGPNQVDRISRGSFFVKNWGVSILSATTPGALKKLAAKLPTDGLLQRFMPLIVASRGKPDSLIYDIQMRDARGRYEALVRRLYGLGAPASVRLGREAREIFEGELERLRDATEAAEAISEGFAAHLAKHSAMLARVALVYHCATSADHREDIDAGSMRAAANLMRKIGRHAMAVYFDLIANNTAPALILARDVARLLIARMPDSFERRDLTQRVHAFRSATPLTKEQAMQYLADCGWISPLAIGYDKGHPTAWAVNPKLATKFEREGEAERRRRAAVRELIVEEGGERHASSRVKG